MGPKKIEHRREHRAGSQRMSVDQVGCQMATMTGYAVEFFRAENNTKESNVPGGYHSITSGIFADHQKIIFRDRALQMLLVALITLVFFFGGFFGVKNACTCMHHVTMKSVIRFFIYIYIFFVLWLIAFGW